MATRWKTHRSIIIWAQRSAIDKLLMSDTIKASLAHNCRTGFDFLLGKVPHFSGSPCWSPPDDSHPPLRLWSERQSGSSVRDVQEEPNFWSSGGDNARFDFGKRGPNTCRLKLCRPKTMTNWLFAFERILRKHEQDVLSNEPLQPDDDHFTHVWDRGQWSYLKNGSNVQR